VLRGSQSKQQEDSMNERGTYQAPAIKELGSLQELTQVNKYFNKNADFTYPTGFSFNFS
jgi:hypothetical protein